MTKLLPPISLFFVLIFFQNTLFYAQDFDTACQTSQPFCSDASEDLTFPNTTGDIDGLGEVGCLNTTPNPAWYFILIDEPGRLVFDIKQWVDEDLDNRLDSRERLLDVDFIAWGPFPTSYIVDCEEQLERGCDLNADGENIRPAECVNNVDEPDFYVDNLDNTNIVDCSYARATLEDDTNKIETLTLPDAQSEEYYIILITNFADEAGVIQLEQTNVGEDGAGTTNCSVLEPGIAQDRIAVCGPGSYPITVEGRYPGSTGPPEVLAAETFQWSRADLGSDVFTNVVGATLPFLEVSSNGVYRLRGFNSAGTEVPDSPDQVAVLDVTGIAYEIGYNIAEASFSGNYTITAEITTDPITEAAGFTDFEYSLYRDLNNGGGFFEYAPYQSSPVFEDVPPGDYQIIARYANCPDSELEDDEIIMILGYPKFFTPNGDNAHDTWDIINPEDQPTAAIVNIFDRYGKLLKQIVPGGAGWDGTYNGSPMPSSQYWFRVEFNEQDDRDVERSRRVFKGSFSLIR